MIDATKTDAQFETYRKTATVKAVQMNEPFEVLSPSGLNVGEPGDYLMEGEPGDRWVCKKDVFEKTYVKADTA